jgi:hypothetical protein
MEKTRMAAAWHLCDGVQSVIAGRLKPALHEKTAAPFSGAAV